MVIKIYDYLPLESDRYTQVNEKDFDKVKETVVKWPETVYSNGYTTDRRGGSNLTVGEIVELGKTLKMYGGPVTKVSIKDPNENKLYFCEY